MNTPSPLVPQGTIPSRGKTNVYFKVLMILAVHVVVIGGMLLQGCKDTKDTGAIQPVPDTNATAATNSPDTLPPVATAAGVSNAATGGVAQTPPPVGQPQPVSTPGPVVQPPPQPAPVQAPVAVAPPAAPTATDTHEYAIATGDTLGALAKKNGISLKTLLEANPGINPRKLKVGQKIQIPGSTGAVASTAAGATGASADVAAGSGDSETYTVKAGDTLGKIAKANHTSYKKLMALNDLKTTSIKVGQKLKLPAPKVATETPAAPIAAPAPAPAPVQPTTPVTTTAAVTAPSAPASN